MRSSLLGAVLAAGCSTTAAPPKEPIAKAPVDDCGRFAAKSRPVVLELLAAAGRPLPGDTLDGELRERCAASRAGLDTADPIVGCVIAAVDDAAVRACYATAVKAYAGTVEQTEAQHQLAKLGKNARVYFVTMAGFPIGSVGPTPAMACCGQPDHLCPATGEWTASPIWAALEFQIDEPSRFQYRYESDGTRATVRAVGDLDCDGVPITYTLEVSAPDGNVRSTITEPPPGAD